jgi:hypothetical protein
MWFFMAKKKNKIKKVSIKKRVEKKYSDIKEGSNLIPIISGVGISTIAWGISKMLPLKIGMEPYKDLRVLIPGGLTAIGVIGAVLTGKRMGLFFGVMALVSGIFTYLNYQEVIKEMSMIQRNMRARAMRHNPRNNPKRLTKTQQMFKDMHRDGTRLKWSEKNQRNLINGVYSESSPRDFETSKPYPKYPSGKSYPFRKTEVERIKTMSLNNRNKQPVVDDVVLS